VDKQKWLTVTLRDLIWLERRIYKEKVRCVKILLRLSHFPQIIFLKDPSIMIIKKM
jgi:hypothetical protein